MCTSSLSMIIWHDVMQTAHAGREPRDLPGLTPVLAEAPTDQQGGGLGGLIEQLFGNHGAPNAQ